MKKFIQNDYDTVEIYDDDELYNGFHKGEFVEGTFLIVEGDKHCGWYKDKDGLNDDDLFNQIMFENDSEKLRSDLTREDATLLSKNGFRYYDKGIIFNGICDSTDLKFISFTEGALTEGFVEYKKYLLKDGLLFTGYREGIKYEDGEKFNDYDNGIYYKEGKPFTGIDGWDEYYVNGRKYSGLDESGREWDMGNPRSGTKEVDGKYYEYSSGVRVNGKRYGKTYYKGLKCNWFVYKWKKMFKYE